MPATPAWPPKSAPRLFIDTLLAGQSEVMLTGPQAHYLLHVMRGQSGDPVIMFDDRSGEYLAHIGAVGKRDLMLIIDRQTRPRETVPDLWLLAAPVKKDRFQMIVEKATELGVERIVPVLTERSHAMLAKPDKLRHYLIEAAEQCERTALPMLAPPQRLDALLAAWPTERRLFFADERLHREPSQTDARRAMAAHGGPAAILIGPEGGFTDAENAAIRAHAAAAAISLGPRILRAETAAIAAVSLWMAIAPNGDWCS